MPLRFQDIQNDFALGVWLIDENEQTLIDVLPEQDSMTAFVKHRQKHVERLAARVLVKYLVEKMGLGYEPLSKSATKKPYFKNLALNVSISHCYPYAAAILHQKYEVGIDIQQPDDKIRRIFERIMDKKEIEQATDLDTQTLFWSAKEALYKLFDSEGVFFKEEIHVKLENGELRGKLRDSTWLSMPFFEIDGMKVVWVSQNN